MDNPNTDYEAWCHAYFDGRMTLAEEKAFFDAMQQTPALYETFEGYLAVHKHLRTHVPQEPSSLLETRILAAIREEAEASPQVAPLRRRWHSPVAAAVLGIAIVSSMLLWPQETPPSTSPLATETGTIAEQAALVEPLQREVIPNSVQPAVYHPAETQFADTFEEAWHEVGTAPQDMAYLADETEWLDPDMN